jgi:hypothetical protein
MRPVTAASFGVVVGLALGFAIGRGSLGPGGAEGPAVAVLEAELDRERAIGEALRDRVEDLEARVSEALASEGATGAPAALAGPDEPGGAAEGSLAATDDDPPDGDLGRSEADPPGGFEDQRLLDLGFHPRDVERLRRAWEATRDGRHWLKMRQLENATLEELGESDYDAMLYATGDKNRISVTRVFPESPAEEAGFVEGDQITAYDDKPIYRMHTLKGETTRCELGTTVSVTVLRDGAERRIWTPCGPLGIQLEMVSAPPR